MSGWLWSRPGRTVNDRQMGCFSVAPVAAERRGWITKSLEVREVGGRGSAVAATALTYAVEVPPSRDAIR